MTVPDAAADPIRIVAAVITDAANRLLVVRKAGTTVFMQPGGKPDAGEMPLATLARELGEEIDCRFDPQMARRLGVFTAPAANEPGRSVEAELFAVTLIGTPRACAEIVEVRWFDTHDRGAVDLAPLTAACVLPLLRI